MNYFKTTILLALLTGLLVLLGQALGGNSGGLMALIIAGGMNFIAFWFSDKIVLAMYRAKPVSASDAPELHAVTQGLARRAGLPMPKLFIIESETPNAFATGRSPHHASVAATTGILRLLGKDELEAVLAHELAHVKNRDTLISTIAATVAGAITWIAHIAQWGAMFGASRDDEDRGGGVGALFMAILAPVAATLIQLAISRGREYAADRTSAEITRKPLGLASALSRLEQGVKLLPMREGNPSTGHLFIVNPFRGSNVLNLFSTHPPIAERIRRLREMAGQR